MHVNGCPVQCEPAGHERMPELMPIEGSGCTVVVIKIPSVTLAPLLPMVNPLMVITNGDVPIAAVDVVKTIEVELALLHTTVRSVTLAAPAWTKGEDGAKKLEG